MISVATCYALIYVFGIVGLVYAFLNYARVKRVSLKQHTDFEMTTPYSRANQDEIALDREKILAMLEIGEYISTVNSITASLHC